MGTRRPKLAITVDPDVHAGVVAAAAAEGVSVSAWMTQAARGALRVREGLAAVGEWEAEHCPLTDEELAAARRRVAGPGRGAQARVTAVVYDAAANRSVREVWADHRVRLEAGLVPVVPAPVVAQVSRSPSQVQLRRLLAGCEVVPLTEPMAHAAGQLLGRARSADVVAAAVVQVAAGLRADVVTGDRGDITCLIEAAGAACRVIDV